ncbi:hypothetical protein Pmani_013939 [Petrolisthes manimaculis]|uniref:CCHC-type domain-containing protein n=1 Tax=Petrolisthes manimaculis TaxID=1843537 RepID=A0AAE1U8V9_9EUCA|nr:hypothetical protein Pmani_013939 [Petrolisthes manimaculis]
MEGQRGRIDATDQIKQLLRLPPEDAGAAPKPAPSENKTCTPPQVVPPHKQMSSSNRELSGGSPSTRQHTHHHNPHHHHQWDPHRYHDSRHNSPGRGGGGTRGYYDSPRTHYDSGRQHYDALRSHYDQARMHYDPSRTPPIRFQNQYGRQRTDSYGSPGRGGVNIRGYEMGRDHKDLRMNNNHHHQQQQQQRPGPHHNSNNNNHLSNSSSSSSSVQGGQDNEPPDFLPSPEVLAELEQHFIYPLKKKSLKFPKAKYFCRLCDYHCDSLVVCKRHVSETRHRKLKEAKDLETTLKNLPTATEVQVAAIDKLINSLAEEWRVDKVMAKQRQEVVTQLGNLLMDRIKGCRLEMVGSSLSGFCLKTSDINIDVVMEDNLNPSTALLAVKELVTCHRLYRDVKDDLTSSYPTMSFSHVETGLRVVVGAGGSASKLTNQLLADYASLDPRVHTLGVAFRRWAQLCRIDDQARGTLPPHVFPLMVVHFLQQHRPHLLPCLHPKPDSETYCRPEELKDKWQTMNSESVGKLWLELFRFYTIGFKMADNVINVRQLPPMPKHEKTWSKKITVEDPFVQKRNLTRTVSGNPVFEYIADRLKATYKYFAVPQLSYGPLFIHIVAKETRTGSGGRGDAALSTKKGDVLLESIEKAGHSLSEGSSECEMERTEDVLEETTESEDNHTASSSVLEKDLSTLALEEMTEETGDSVTRNGVTSEEEGEGEAVINIEEVTSPISSITTTQASNLISQVLNHHLSYKFDGQKFTCGQSPPLICGSCQKEGHCKADCHEDDLPPLKNLPAMNNYFLNQLTIIFERLTRDFEPSNEEIEERDRIVADLESYIRQFFQTVTLKLFGSSANGFGFQGSDLDICLTFDGNPSGANIDHIKIIESLAEKLKRYRQCGHVFAITTAKVPIVKFSIRRACLEGDLSLYNTLALQNTKLLSTYASIDYRVKCLGYAMKYFAKLCDIGDASRGSLSSYAYILMVLHFLQQCHPPVIPVLQELYDHSQPAPRLMIDGWNAWFYDDLPNLKSVWKDYGKNKESVGQLWVGMLRYYTETFNWKEHVVTIRQAAPLTRLQKLWNSRCIAIEDPFDLSHNLGAGLSRKMNTFIMKAFIRGRELFGSAIMAPPPGYRNLVDYLFDCKQLTDGAPPNDRGCRFCGKIGHIQKDCPKKKVNIEKRDKKERQKDRREMRRSTEAEMPEKSTIAEAGVRGGRERRETRPSQGPPALMPSCTLPEGNLELVIPRSMMEKHCHRWTGSQQYQAAGHHYLGMARLTSIEVLASQTNPRLVVCQVAPAAADQSSTEQSSADFDHSDDNQEYKWTVDLDRTTETILSDVDPKLEPDWPIYRYILDLIKKHLQKEATEKEVGCSLEKHIEQAAEKVKSCNDGAHIVGSFKRDPQQEVTEKEMGGSGEKCLGQTTEKVMEGVSDIDTFPDDTSFILKEKLNYMTNIMHEKKKEKKEKRILKYKKKAAQEREVARKAYWRSREENGKSVMVRDDIRQGSISSNNNPNMNTTTGAAGNYHRDLRVHKNSAKGYQGPDSKIINMNTASYYKGNQSYKSPVGPEVRSQVFISKKGGSRASCPGFNLKAVITPGPEREVVTVSSKRTPFAQPNTHTSNTTSKCSHNSTPSGQQISGHQAIIHTGHSSTPTDWRISGHQANTHTSHSSIPSRVTIPADTCQPGTIHDEKGSMLSDRSSVVSGQKAMAKRNPKKSKPNRKNKEQAKDKKEE